MAATWFELGTQAVGRAIQIASPAVGIIDGVIQSVSGDPFGPIKILVPGVGIVEALYDSAGDIVLSETGQAVIKSRVAQNVGFSFGTVAMVGGGLLLLVLLLKK